MKKNLTIVWGGHGPLWPPPGSATALFPIRYKNRVHCEGVPSLKQPATIKFIGKLNFFVISCQLVSDNFLPGHRSADDKLFVRQRNDWLSSTCPLFGRQTCPDVSRGVPYDATLARRSQLIQNSRMVAREGHLPTERHSRTTSICRSQPR